MRIIKAPEEYQPHPAEVSIFLAGGISGCPDWQSELADLLRNDPGLEQLPLVLLNPRRVNYPWHDPSKAREQIAWEHRHLARATAVSFWFPCETLAPITLFEYGKCLVGQQPLFVGVHPDYSRRLDLEIQTDLQRPQLQLVDSVADLARVIAQWLQSGPRL